MSCGIDIQDGVPAGGGGAVVVAAEWTERNLGDFVAAPDVDLTAGVNPTVTVANGTTTPGQVASTLWTSNAGDATATVTQTGTSAFATNANGLDYVGTVDASSLFVETNQNAPHIWSFWNLLLGEAPRAGVDYCVLVLYTLQTLNTNGHSAGVGLYEVNDGTPNPTLLGNPAIDDEKRLSGALEQQSGSLGIICREESTPFQQLIGAGLPANFDVWGLMLSGHGVAQAVVGVSPGAGLFPPPDELVAVPGPFLGGSTTYPSHPYLVPAERVAIFNQQQLGSSYNTRASHYQVLSRGGRTAP